MLQDVTAHIEAGTRSPWSARRGRARPPSAGSSPASPPTAGTIRVGGVSLTRVDNDALRRRWSSCAGTVLFDDSIAANLAFAPPGMDAAEITRAIESLDLQDWLEALPEGWRRGSDRAAPSCRPVNVNSWHSPRVDDRPGRAGAGRGDVVGRRADRGASGARPRPARRGTDHDRHRAPAVDGARAHRVLVLDHGRLVEDGDARRPRRCGGVYARMYDAWGGGDHRMSRLRTALSPVGLALVAVWVIWGSTYLGIRIGLETMPPFTIAGDPLAVAGSLLYAAMRRRGAPRPTSVQWRHSALVGCLLLLGGLGRVTIAEDRGVGSGLTATMIAISRCGSRCGAGCGDDGPVRREWLGMVVGLGAVWCSPSATTSADPVWAWFSCSCRRSAGPWQRPDLPTGPARRGDGERVRDAGGRRRVRRSRARHR